jgi:hypothetical protein
MFYVIYTPCVHPSLFFLRITVKTTTIIFVALYSTNRRKYFFNYKCAHHIMDVYCGLKGRNYKQSIRLYVKIDHLSSLLVWTRKNNNNKNCEELWTRFILGKYAWRLVKTNYTRKKICLNHGPVPKHILSTVNYKS